MHGFHRSEQGHENFHNVYTQYDTKILYVYPGLESPYDVNHWGIRACIYIIYFILLAFRLPKRSGYAKIKVSTCGLAAFKTTKRNLEGKSLSN